MENARINFSDGVSLSVTFGQEVDGDGEIVGAGSPGANKTAFVAQVFWAGESKQGQFNCYPRGQYRSWRDSKINLEKSGIEELDPPPPSVDRILTDLKRVVSPEQIPKTADELMQKLGQIDPELFAKQ